MSNNSQTGGLHPGLGLGLGPYLISMAPHLSLLRDRSLSDTDRLRFYTEDKWLRTRDPHQKFRVGKVLRQLDMYSGAFAPEVLVQLLATMETPEGKLELPLGEKEFVWSREVPERSREVPDRPDPTRETEEERQTRLDYEARQRAEQEEEAEEASQRAQRRQAEQAEQEEARRQEEARQQEEARRQEEVELVNEIRRMITQLPDQQSVYDADARLQTALGKDYGKKMNTLNNLKSDIEKSLEQTAQNNKRREVANVIDQITDEQTQNELIRMISVEGDHDEIMNALYSAHIKAKQVLDRQQKGKREEVQEDVPADVPADVDLPPVIAQLSSDAQTVYKVLPQRFQKQFIEELNDDTEKGVLDYFKSDIFPSLEKKANPIKWPLTGGWFGYGSGKKGIGAFFRRAEKHLPAAQRLGKQVMKSFRGGSPEADHAAQELLSSLRQEEEHLGQAMRMYGGSW